MKKFILFLLMIAAFSVAWTWVLERTDLLRLHTAQLDPFFEESDGVITMYWTPLPYPCRYRIDGFSRTTGLVDGASKLHLFSSEMSDKPSYRLPSTAIPMMYQITAYGLLGEMAEPFPSVENPAFCEPVSPRTIFHYTKKNPASLMPYLVWHPVPGAVCYELEFLSEPPGREGGTRLADRQHLYSTQRIYTNGWQADLSRWKNREKLYWRVRALNLQKEPIGEFSPTEELYLDTSLTPPDYPLINTFVRMPDEYPLLYPVYQWIPMHDIARYEVELMDRPPAEEHNDAPTPSRIWHHLADDSFSCYDEYARPYAGAYYWRVRAIDENGRTIGRYSKAARFDVPEVKERPYAAAFGDSITHGGGALSYSPANREYDYMTYLDFPAMNLGQSGDTSRATLLRFDEDVLPYRPYNLIILTGSNDLRSDRTAKDIIDDLDGIRIKCEENDIRPIFLTLMPIHPENIYQAFRTETDAGWQDKLDEINRFIRRQDYYIDLEPYFYNEARTMLDAPLAIDGLHPDIRGKMLMAEVINRHRSLFREP